MVFVPVRVCHLDQRDFPCSPPRLDALFPDNRLVHPFVNLQMDEAFDSVKIRVSHKATTVMIQASLDTGCHTNVQAFVEGRGGEGGPAGPLNNRHPSEGWDPFQQRL
jgi:hypothetical protein